MLLNCGMARNLTSDGGPDWRLPSPTFIPPKFFQRLTPPVRLPIYPFKQQIDVFKLASKQPSPARLGTLTSHAIQSVWGATWGERLPYKQEVRVWYIFYFRHGDKGNATVAINWPWAKVNAIGMVLSDLILGQLIPLLFSAIIINHHWWSVLKQHSGSRVSIYICAPKCSFLVKKQP